MVDRLTVIRHAGIEWPQRVYVDQEGDGIAVRRVAQSWKRVDVVPASQLQGAVSEIVALVETMADAEPKGSGERAVLLAAASGIRVKWGQS